MARIMAVYTHISEAELKAHLVLYDIGGLVSFAGISEGVSNTNYLITTDRNKFILTLFEGRTAEADLPFFFDFMAHLGKKGLPVASPIPMRDGKIIARIKDRAAAVTSFLNGAWPRETTAQQCAAMGATLAQMHAAAQDFKETRANGMGITEWRRLIDACGARADAVETGLAAFLQEELAFLEKNLPQDLPKGAVHADVFPDNVFFENEKLSGVIDFYFSCTDAFAYDLMLTLNAWAFDAKGMPGPDKAAALLNAYTAARPLSREERAALPLFGRAAALRIVATRLYDLLHPAPGAVVTPKDPLAHVRILRFHRSVSSPASYGLAA
jgi:homoserine kinase type II